MNDRRVPAEGRTKTQAEEIGRLIEGGILLELSAWDPMTFELVFAVPVIDQVDGKTVGRRDFRVRFIAADGTIEEVDDARR
ncbi:MAG: hypothetical protein AMS19_02505 [Gemmatimonas sp. SG8_23]|jgi:hypothetical protein|nr:MAG: hypothetical protein AMS19_02505 [Gemmatimonas sp. SG8_23]